ncbi:insulinase family protein [Leptobacterium flavescens]|uniref:Insulinase family protein n=1 Tax=Leptobacterium flavescens TaxID=472055 RepID=A0A6P0UFS5_9FLAO|nr:insulinase family protein [Leptobacterium flavescens]NER12131.1 insulinase family protein [Leptobacterium flavescens]
MKNNKWLSLLLSALVFGSMYGQVTKTPDKQFNGSIGTEKLPVDPNVKIGKLSNGLTYYIRNNGKPEDKVELRLAVNVGSILEDDDQRGLAHFMEHMNFNGTKNFKKNELVDYLQSIGVEFGADLNAYTSFDQTVYILPIPSDDPEKLEKGFQILEDWASGALLTEKDIDEERGVVLEEYRLSLGADTRMLQKYLPIIANNSKYAERLPIGTKESLENFSYESLRRFYKDWYRPDLMAVVAVGDLDVETLEKKIKDHFGGIKASKNPRKRESFTIPNHEETYIAIESDKEAPFTRVQVQYTDKGKKGKTETVQDFRANLVENLFTQMINNRLSELRNKPNPPFVFGFSFHGGTLARDKEAYQSSATTSETGQLAGLRALLEENERVKRYGFQESEFKRAKKNYLASLERAYKDRDKQESNRIVGSYINNYLNGSPITGIEWTYNFAQAELPNIKLEEVNALIKDFLHDDNRTVILTGPEKDGLKKVTKDEVSALLKEVQTADIKPYEDGNTRTQLMTSLPSKGNITSRETNDKLGITTLTLSNGAKVVYKKTDFKNDQILFEAYSLGGTSLYSDQVLKEAALANGGLAEAGVDGLSVNDLRKVLSGKIVNVRPFITSLTEGFRGSSTPKDLESLFQLVHLYFTKLNKDKDAYTSYVSKQKGFLANLKSNPQFYFSIERGKFLNEGNPRFLGFPTDEAYDKANYDLAYEKYKERFANAGDFNFYFVGNIDEAKIAELAETYLASLPSNGTKENFKVYDFRPKSGSHEFTVKKGKDPKSQVSIAYSGETTYDRKEARLLSALGKILTIKLVEKLREEESGVYGVGARGSIGKLPYSSFNFTISFPCGPENVEKLTAAALAEVQKIVDNGPEEADVTKVKESLLLERKEQMKQNRFWLATLKNADYLGNNLNDLSKFESNVEALNAKDIQAVAKKYLTKGYIKSVLFPETE